MALSFKALAMPSPPPRLRRRAGAFGAHAGRGATGRHRLPPAAGGLAWDLDALRGHRLRYRQYRDIARQALDDFDAEESRHGHSELHTGVRGNEPMIGLF